MKYSVELLLIFVLTSHTLGFIAYDCSDHRTGIAVVNNVEVGDCAHTFSTPEVTYAQNVFLLHKPEIKRIPYKSCLITVDYTISESTSGLHRDQQYAESVIYSEIIELGHAGCTQLHQNMTLNITSFGITATLILNSPMTINKMIVGTCIEYCKGSNFTSPYGSWEDVIVWAHYEIEMTDGMASTDYTESILILPTGTKFPLYSNYGLDNSKGEIIWNADHFQCNNKYNVIFSGMAKIIRYREHFIDKETYIFETPNEIFALNTVIQSDTCNIQILRTEHPQLFIVNKMKTTSISQFISDTLSLKPYSTDLIFYANSKFVWIKSYIGNNINDSYFSLVQQKCNIEREILSRKLFIASYSLSEFAYAVGGGPGYFAISSGEIIYLLKCKAAPVKVFEQNKCFNELPVTFNNQTYYMHPKTRILQKYATEINCSNSFPPVFSINGTWFNVFPSINATKTPQMLTLDTHFTYISPKYPMLGQEIKETQNNLVKLIMNQNLLIYNIKDLAEIQLIAVKHLKSSLGLLQTSGIVFLGSLSLFIIFKMVYSKLVKKTKQLKINSDED